MGVIIVPTAPAARPSVFYFAAVGGCCVAVVIAVAVAGRGVTVGCVRVVCVAWAVLRLGPTVVASAVLVIAVTHRDVGSVVRSVAALATVPVNFWHGRFGR